MRNTPTQTPFFLVSTWCAGDKTDAAVESRANRVAEQLNANNVPFRQLDFKVKGCEDQAIRPVFLLDHADKTVVQRIALENFQSHYIAVNAFKVGTRVNAYSFIEENVVGVLREIQPSLIELHQAYLQRDHLTYIWDAA